MKKLLLTIIAAASLGQAAAARENTALGRLLADGGEEITIPMAPLPDRGGAIDYTLKWDPEAPLLYNQNPAELLSDKDGVVIMKNVRWGPTPADHKSYVWETLTIKPALLEKAVYAYKTFGTGHTLLIFTFKEGGAVNSRGESVNALTFGAEGWSREPKGYNITHAIAGKYPLIWLATTFESYSDYVVNYRKTEIFFKNINIGPEQASRLLALTLARVDETNRNKETYNLFSNSCTNNPVNLLNQVLPKERRISLEVAGLANPNAAIPKYAVKKFTEKGALRAETFKIDQGNYSAFDITKI